MVSPRCDCSTSTLTRRTRRNDLGEHELERRAEMARHRWDSLGDYDKFKDWATRHKFGIVGGGWVAGMATAMGIVMRDPLQTFPQKLVQARMWAQGWTIALVVGAAVLSRSPVRDHNPVDHSWKTMVRPSASCLYQRAYVRDCRSMNMSANRNCNARQSRSDISRLVEDTHGLYTCICI